VQQGSLYPALHRLENRGWLGAVWKTSDTGREAKYYTLTREGARQLAKEDENWQRLTRAVQLVMDTAR
jgi:DNA-binding PadR family transcriptional regulator